MRLLLDHSPSPAALAVNVPESGVPFEGVEREEGTKDARSKAGSYPAEAKKSTQGRRL